MGTWQIMHGEQHIASVSEQGRAQIFDEARLPWMLYLEEECACPWTLPLPVDPRALPVWMEGKGKTSMVR